MVSTLPPDPAATSLAVPDTDEAARAARPRSWRSVARQVVARPVAAIALALAVLTCLLALVPALFAGWFGHGDPHACDLRASLQGPSAGHPFGVDQQGCDYYSNVIYGARTSLAIGLLATVMVALAAVVLGTAAGYFGGVVDTVIGRLMDVFFGFPALIGMIVLLQSFAVHDVFTISLTLALFSWPTMTRAMRTSVRSTVAMDYVVAARSLGAGLPRILLRHILPNAVAPVVALAGLYIGAFITTEASLSFLGVGLVQPTISWGGQLNASEQDFSSNIHLLVFPALFLTLTVLAFVVVGDAVRDALDPKRSR